MFGITFPINISEVVLFALVDFKLNIQVSGFRSIHRIAYDLGVAESRSIIKLYQTCFIFLIFFLLELRARHKIRTEVWIEIIQSFGQVEGSTLTHIMSEASIRLWIDGKFIRRVQREAKH